MLNERLPHSDDGDKMEVYGEITHGPFAKPLMNRLFKRFGKTAFGRSSACAEFEDFLEMLAKRRDATHRTGMKIGTTCLEIGTFHGITAIILSQFFDHVIGVSIDEMQVRKHEFVAYLGIKNITFIDCKDNAEKKHVIDGLKFDFCYQDGDHTHDTYDDWELVRRCGRVLFHEYWPLQAPVWNLVNSLPQDEVIRAKYDCLAYWEAKNG